MKIREANNQDAARVKEIVFGVLAEYGLFSSPKTTDADLEDIEQHYLARGGYFGVVEVEGEIVATLGLYKLNEQCCELRKMYALPSARGKGLGKYLMEFGLAKARELGFRKVHLETASPLKEAIGLYKKYGFKEFQSEHLASRCDKAFELELFSATPH